MLKLSLIAALADNSVIGINNQLPWHLPADLKHFKALTVGKPIIMGRNTWDSLAKALPQRLNIVVSRQKDFTAEGAEVFSSLKDAIYRADQWANASQQKEIMLIGGAQLYKLALEECLVNHLYLTRVHLMPKGDAWFPAFDKTQWQKHSSEAFAAVEDKPAYTFEHWVRV